MKVHDEIRAKRFVLEDNDGVERATLEMRDGEYPALTFWRPESRTPLITIGTPLDEPAIHLHGDDGKIRTAWHLELGDPVLRMRDKDFGTSLRLGVQGNQYGFFVLDQEEVCRLRVGYHFGQHQVGIVGGAVGGDPQFSLLGTNAGGAIAILDDGGRLVFVRGSVDPGSPEE